MGSRCCLIAWVPLLAAQRAAPAGSIRGVVRDATGLVLPGATVELRLPGSTATRSAVSGADGTFDFLDVPVGTYRLVVTFPGFAPAEQRVTVDAQAHAPLLMVPGALRSAGAGLGRRLHRRPPQASATMHTPVGRRVIETLPSESVNAGLSSLITLTTPGVAADSNGSIHPLGEHAETSFSVDGQPITDQQSRTFSNQLPQDAIQSMDVVTGVPSAEFGDKTSLVVNATTRSGLGLHPPTGSVSLGTARSIRRRHRSPLAPGRSASATSWPSTAWPARGSSTPQRSHRCMRKATSTTCLIDSTRVHPREPVSNSMCSPPTRSSRPPTPTISRRPDKTSNRINTVSMWPRPSREP